ncbi:hypothetical protein U9M48_016868 [Paspalum notatum var. saurae]|uniref:Uncharacterized protein n=1 Tax=Paspalum notatum var. saurae TaxID=547442 RepID=A0AAQ3WNL8_PASNO
MARPSKVACVLVVCALVAAGLGSASARAPLGGKPQREFDYFALALQWPGTICASTHKCCAKNGCCRSEPIQTFTIRECSLRWFDFRDSSDGLWPDYDDGTWPSCCRRTQFEMDKILPLMEVLNKYWPSLYCSTSSTCFSGKGPFWAHEVRIIEFGADSSVVLCCEIRNYASAQPLLCFILHAVCRDGIYCSIRLLLITKKHGTCSAPVVQDELQYFTLALDLYFKYNVTEMLSSGGIQISNAEEYALSDVIDTIKHAFGGVPEIVCKKGSVEELRLCFDKELKPRDCLTTLTSGSVSSSKCPQYITLPTYDPLVLANSTGEIMTQFNDFEVSAALYTD